ncbi:MAG: SRPBCC family protein [Colwellia sp.]|nr:SRPBCC family protein [Colwellia sp.]
MTNISLPTDYCQNKSITINAPLDEVWSIIADFNHVYTWAPSVTHSHSLNEKDQQIGAARHCDIEGFGSIDEVITQWQEKSGFTYTVTDLGPLTAAQGRWKIEAVNHHETNIVIEFGYNLKFGVIGKVLHSLMMKNKLSQGLTQTLSALKKRVESGNLVRPVKIDKLAYPAT